MSKRSRPAISGHHGEGSCEQADANCFAARTPDHGCTGRGGRHRRSPIGGAAKGIPKKMAAFTDDPSNVPSTRPDCVITCGVPGREAYGRDAVATNNDEHTERRMNVRNICFVHTSIKERVASGYIPLFV